MESRLAKIDIKRFETAVKRYIKSKQDFETEKQAFSKAAEIFFYLKGDTKHTIQTGDDTFLTVSKVQKAKITWNISKLKSILGKEVSKRVIDKRYTIVNMNGLIEYLKSCGVDPQKFKSFISTEESVNVKELDQMEQLGKVKREDLKDCYSVKLQDPYYSVRSGKTMDGKAE
jgi:hypothetical protein